MNNCEEIKKSLTKADKKHRAMEKEKELVV